MSRFNYKKIFKWIRNLFAKKEQSFKPKRDWRIILVSFFVLFILLVIFHTVFFLGLNSDSFFRSNITTEQIEIEVDIEKFDEVFEFFEKKQQHFDLIRENGISTFDPSL